MRAANELASGLSASYSQEDRFSLHRTKSDAAVSGGRDLATIGNQETTDPLRHGDSL